MVLRISRVTAALALAVAFTSQAAAQTNRLHFGPRASYHFDLEKFGVGAQFGAPIASHLEFYPSFDYFFVDSGSFWNLNADLKWRIASQSVRWLYLGTGLNLARSGGGGAHHSDAGLNISPAPSRCAGGSTRSESSGSWCGTAPAPSSRSA